MGAVDETIVIGELNEGAWPGLFDLANLGDDFLDGLELVAGGELDGAGAELAFVRAAAAGLHGDAVVLLRIEQVKARHGRMGEIELTTVHVKRFQ